MIMKKVLTAKKKVVILSQELSPLGSYKMTDSLYLTTNHRIVKS